MSLFRDDRMLMSWQAEKNIAAGTELFMDYGPDFPIDQGNNGMS